MAVKRYSTTFPGVRYYKHPTRKHGVNFDRYFSIRYQRDGKRREEGLGWASEGWTAESAFNELSALKRAHKKGEGATSMAEKRAHRKKAKEKARIEAKRKAKQEITFAKYWKTDYYPQAQVDKDLETYRRELGLFNNWLTPVIGALPFHKIARIHLERVKKNMADAKLSPRSIQYALAVARQVINQAKVDGIYSGDNPTIGVKRPKFDNRRQRFLTKDEAKTLLDRLHAENRAVWEMALVSLHCGLRAKEIFKLRWQDIDTITGFIKVQGKGEKVRFSSMTQPVKDMFMQKVAGKASHLLYPNPKSGIMREVSGTYARVVKDLGFNDGIEDRRDKVVFHTLRHTYASWLVQNGEDLYVLKELMGHSTIVMTERYAHLAPKNKENSVSKIEKIWNEKDEKSKPTKLFSESTPAL